MEQLLQDALAKPCFITLSGREYKLAYNFRAVIAYRQQTGVSIFDMEALGKISPEEKPEQFIALLWAGLRSHHPQVTLEALPDLIDWAHVYPAVAAIAAALQEHLPKGKSDPNPQPPASPADLSGKSESPSSGPSPDTTSASPTPSSSS